MSITLQLYSRFKEEDDEPTLQQLFYEEQKNPKRGKIKRNFFEDDEGKRITYQEINNNEEASRRGTYTRRQTLEYFDPPNGTEPPDGSHPPSQNMTLQRGATRPTEQKRGTENSPMRNLRVETLRSAHMPDDPPPSLNATLQRGIVRSPQLLVDSSTDSPEDDIEVLPPKKSISTSSGSSSEEDVRLASYVTTLTIPRNLIKHQRAVCNVVASVYSSKILSSGQLHFIFFSTSS